MPDWLFWIIVWWAAWFAAFLSWYASTKKEPIPGLVLFFIAMFSWIMPFLILFGIFAKLRRKDK